MAKPSPQHSGNATLVSLGRAIKTTRLTLGQSQEASAATAGLDRSYMGGVELGEHNLTVMTVVQISQTLNLKGWCLGVASLDTLLKLANRLDTTVSALIAPVSPEMA